MASVHFREAMQFFVFWWAFFIVAMPVFTTGAVHIIQSPSNATVFSGDPVFFHCGYTGTNSLPYWLFNGEAVSASRLPGGMIFIYQDQSLCILHTASSMNNTRIACAFIAVSSTTAHLVVHGSSETALNRKLRVTKNESNVEITCEYTGTNSLPYWKINGTIYAPARLPPAYNINMTGLSFTYQHQHEYRTSFQCLMTNSDGKILQSEALNIAFKTGEKGLIQPVASCQFQLQFIGYEKKRNSVFLYWNPTIPYCYSYLNSRGKVTQNCGQTLGYTELRTEDLYQLLNFSIWPIPRTNCGISRLTSNFIDTELITGLVNRSLKVKLEYRCSSSVICVKQNNSRVACFTTMDILQGNLPAGYQNCGNRSLDICIEQVTKSMNETLITVFCGGISFCAGRNLCEQVTSSQKIFVPGPPQQPKPPNVFVNTEVVTICLQYPYSQRKIDFFSITAVFNNNETKTFLLQTDNMLYVIPVSVGVIKELELEVAAISDSGASERSQTAYYNFAEDKSSYISDFCLCVDELIPDTVWSVSCRAGSDICTAEIMQPRPHNDVESYIHFEGCSNKVHITVQGEPIMLDAHCFHMYNKTGWYWIVTVNLSILPSPLSGTLWNLQIPFYTTIDNESSGPCYHESSIFYFETKSPNDYTYNSRTSMFAVCLVILLPLLVIFTFFCTTYVKNMVYNRKNSNPSNIIVAFK